MVGWVRVQEREEEKDGERGLRAGGRRKENFSYFLLFKLNNKTKI